MTDPELVWKLRTGRFGTAEITEAADEIEWLRAIIVAGMEMTPENAADACGVGR